MDRSRFVLTTIGNGIVAMLETPVTEEKKRGEYLLSDTCVRKNIEAGTFVDATSQVSGATGKVYILASDLN